jgi:outer membrane autotransporter protein
VITATARTDAQAAATLGISTDQANLLRQAASSGDTTLVDLLTTSINAGPAQTTQAARQVGVQSETVAGGSTVSREMAGQQQRITQDRTGGFRADDPRFVTAFAAVENGETGFAGGDLDGLYTPMGPRYANSVWGQVYGGTALADGTTALAGFDAGFGGAMIGIDGAISDDVVIGAFAGYGFADVDGDGAGNAQLEVSAYQAGVYAGYTGASFYVDAFAAYAMLQNDTTRTTLGPNTVTGEFDASQISVGLSGGAPIAISANGYLTPNASLTWNHYDADGYTETGVGANTVTGFTANTLTGSIGGRLHAVYEISDGSAIIPELSVGLIYDIIDDDGRASATFVGGGAAYTVSGTEISNIGAAIGAGLTMRNDVWSVGLSYDGDIRSDFMSHTGRAEVRMRF